MSEATWFKLQKLVCEAIEAMGASYFRTYRKKLKNDLDKGEMDFLVLALNGAWTHKGYKSRMCSFIVREVNLNEVVVLITLQKENKMLISVSEDSSENNDEIIIKEYKVVKDGNYKGTSKGMEGAAMEIAVEQLNESGLLKHVKYICTDDDGSIVSIIKNTPEMTHIVISHDPGHRQKNLLRSLKDKLGDGKYKTFAYRIGKFYMRCIKRTEEKFPVSDDVLKRVQLFHMLWKHVYTHYIRKQCVNTCP